MTFVVRGSYICRADQFSVDDFDSVKTTPWEGVRNAEARNLMKEMKVGDKVSIAPHICGYEWHA